MKTKANTTSNRIPNTAPKGRKGTVYAYARWSSRGQTGGDSDNRQAHELEQARAYAVANDLTLSEEVFKDPQVSARYGDNRKNGALGALLKRVEEGDHVFIETYSRWSRESRLDGLNALDQTTARGVSVHFTVYGMVVDKSNFTNLLPMLSLHSTLASQEVEELTRKIKSAMDSKRQKLQEGKISFGRLPAWLAWNYPARPRRDDRKVVEIDPKVEQVRKIFQLCIEGHGCRAIEFMMREEPPLANSRRAGWNTRFIHRLLTDRAVLGYHPASPVPVYPAIIDEETFRVAAVKLASRKRYTVSWSRENNSLLTGLAFCARCGRTLVRQSTITKTGRYKYLMCRGGVRREKGCTCGCAGMQYDKVENSLLTLLLHEGNLIRAAMSSGPAGPSPLDVLKGELLELDRKLEQVNRDYEENLSKGHETKALSAMMAKLEPQAEALRARVLEEEAKGKSVLPAGQAYDQFCIEFAEKYQQREYRARIRAALHDFVDRIVVKLGEDCYDVHFKGAKQPVTVTVIREGDYVFSPTADWVLGRECQVAGGNVIG